MEFKGTKGKWFSCCLKTTPHFVFSENGETTICIPIKKQEMSQDLSDEQFRSNALLISKAPEMLEFIVSLLSESEDIVHDEIKKQAKQLIEEATKID